MLCVVAVACIGTWHRNMNRAVEEAKAVTEATRIRENSRREAAASGAVALAIAMRQTPKPPPSPGAIQLVLREVAAMKGVSSTTTLDEIAVDAVELHTPTPQEEDDDGTSSEFETELEESDTTSTPRRAKTKSQSDLSAASDTPPLNDAVAQPAAVTSSPASAPLVPGASPSRSVQFSPASDCVPPRHQPTVPRCRQEAEVIGMHTIEKRYGGAGSTDVDSRSSPRTADAIKIVERERTFDREIIRYVPSRLQEDRTSHSTKAASGSIASLRVDELRDVIRDTMREERDRSNRQPVSLGLWQPGHYGGSDHNPFLSNALLASPLRLVAQHTPACPVAPDHLRSAFPQASRATCTASQGRPQRSKITQHRGGVNRQGSKVDEAVAGAQLDLEALTGEPTVPLDTVARSPPRRERASLRGATKLDNAARVQAMRSRAVQLAARREAREIALRRRPGDQSSFEA